MPQISLLKAFQATYPRPTNWTSNHLSLMRYLACGLTKMPSFILTLVLLGKKSFLNSKTFIYLVRPCITFFMKLRKCISLMGCIPIPFILMKNFNIFWSLNFVKTMLIEIISHSAILSTLFLILQMLKWFFVKCLWFMHTYCNRHVASITFIRSHLLILRVSTQVKWGLSYSKYIIDAT